MSDSDPRNKIQKLIKDHIAKQDATGWFEQLYASAKQNELPIPWARKTSDPDLIKYLSRNQIDGNGKRAIVIGCGIGDDAEALSVVGFDVVAFDISESAITICKERFPKSSVNYVQADLFALPEEWHGAFDFVFESRTIQALPWEYTERAVACIAECVKMGGTLLVNCQGREPHESKSGIPWRLSRDELALFEQHDLHEISFMDYQAEAAPGAMPARRFSVEYRMGAGS